jgi:hypothetical protein
MAAVQLEPWLRALITTINNNTHLFHTFDAITRTTAFIIPVKNSAICSLALAFFAVYRIYLLSNFNLLLLKQLWPELSFFAPLYLSLSLVYLLLGIGRYE